MEMARKGFLSKAGTLFIALSLLISFAPIRFAAAQEPTPEPEMLHPRLDVRTVVSGLTTPTTMAFTGINEFFVLEKNTGMVKHVVDGEAETVLDLAVNFFSERGLLGLALDPEFQTNNFVYLYWSCIAPPPPAQEPFFSTPHVRATEPKLRAASGDTR